MSEQVPSLTPSGYYRVSLKALVLNGQRELLLVQGSSDGHNQIPGGGWEHQETQEECLDREFREELGVGLGWLDERPLCAFKAWHPRLQRWNLRICHLAGLASADFTFGDGIVQALWVPQEGLATANLPPDDRPVLDYQHLIWPPGT